MKRFKTSMTALIASAPLVCLSLLPINAMSATFDPSINESSNLVHLTPNSAKVWSGSISQSEEKYIDVQVDGTSIFMAKANFPIPYEGYNLDLRVFKVDSSNDYSTQLRPLAGPPDMFPGFEISAEAYGFLNHGRRQTYRVSVRGSSVVDQGDFEVTLSLVPWRDGAPCVGMEIVECKKMWPELDDFLVFPQPVGNDSLFKSTGKGFLRPQIRNYSFIRRDLLMLLRHAVAQVEKTFPGTKPLGVGEITDAHGRTPGTDLHSLRHPAGSHEAGKDIDIAYYQTVQNNHLRVVCDLDGQNVVEDAFCSKKAEGTHIVDLRRTAFLVAKLLDSNLVRIIGADPRIGPLIQQEAAKLFGKGIISEASYKNVESLRFYWGKEWPYHHHHLHIALW